jgi:hypothetical protein
MTLALIILDSIFDNINALPLYGHHFTFFRDLLSLLTCSPPLAVPHHSVFRAICAKLHEIVSACFPSRGASHLVLRSFLFVKFICPALVSPDAFGLTDCTPLSIMPPSIIVLTFLFVTSTIPSSAFARCRPYPRPALENRRSNCHRHPLRAQVLLCLLIAHVAPTSLNTVSPLVCVWCVCVYREPYMAPLNDFIQQQSNSDDLRTLLEAILVRSLPYSSPLRGGTRTHLGRCRRTWMTCPGLRRGGKGEKCLSSLCCPYHRRRRSTLLPCLRPTPGSSARRPTRRVDSRASTPATAPAR